MRGPSKPSPMAAVREAVRHIAVRFCYEMEEDQKTSFARRFCPSSKSNRQNNQLKSPRLHSLDSTSEIIGKTLEFAHSCSHFFGVHA